MAGTPVQTVVKAAGGKYRVAAKPIETVKKDDLVLARSEKTGKTQVRRVLRTVVRQVDRVLTVALADAKTHKVVEKITASREHPFFVRGKGFVPAGGLAVGNAIVTRAGPVQVVQSIKWNRRAEGYTVYNFVVEDDHSYFVGTHNGGTWVHNYTVAQLAGVKASGVFNTTVSSEKEALNLARSAFRNGEELLPATGDPYPKPSSPRGPWFQLHPAEFGDPARGIPPVTNDQGQILPHVKYEDWSGGNKGNGGSWGHIFIDPGHGYFPE